MTNSSQHRNCIAGWKN